MHITFSDLMGGESSYCYLFDYCVAIVNLRIIANVNSNWIPDNPSINQGITSGTPEDESRFSVIATSTVYKYIARGLFRSSGQLTKFIIYSAPA